MVHQLSRIWAWCSRFKIVLTGKGSSFFITILIMCLLFPSDIFVSPVNATQENSPIIYVVNQTVNWPIPDGIRLTIPSQLENIKLARMGLVDVTAKPFLADSSGKTDSTKAIQNAVNFARDRQMVCYFPSGTYLISDTIECVQNRYIRTTGKEVGGRNFPCLLMGSREGKRPKILLGHSSGGFNSPENPKYVIHFWAKNGGRTRHPKPNSSMNQMFVGIDIEIGPNNPGAVAIRHRAAQGSAIQDSTIDVRHGLTGIEGGIGSGGSITNISVIGGVYGLDMRETQPVPTLTGITLINQKKHAILYEGRQSLSAVGLKIISSSTGPAIKGLAGGNRPATAQICLVDSEIIFEKPGGTAISSAKSLYLNNVYMKGVAKAISNPDGSEVEGNSLGWLRIVEYAHGVQPKRWKGYQYTAPIYINGKKINKDIILTDEGSAPPAYLQQQHLWQRDFPSWESSEAVNVMNPPYNAKGDAKSDDTEALQKAIDENEIVFLPKGYYQITQPLALQANSKIIGVGRHLSIIMAQPPAPFFSDPNNPHALVVSKDTKKSSTILAFIGLWPPSELPGAYALKWQSGGESVVRAVNFIKQPINGYNQELRSGTTENPLVVISGNGGGLWYNFFQDGAMSGKKYRHILVDKTQGPLRFYQLNPEHTLSDANMEIRQASNISIFGLKGEGNNAVLKVVGSKNIKVFGYGGNASALPGEALIQVEDSDDVLFANMVDTPRTQNKIKEWKGFGLGVNPALWHMIEEKANGEDLSMSASFERPVLYKRGH